MGLGLGSDFSSEKEGFWSIDLSSPDGSVPVDGSVRGRMDRRFVGDSLGRSIDIEVDAPEVESPLLGRAALGMLRLWRQSI